MTGHDQLFKDLFREFFPELLHFADPDLAARLTAPSGFGSFTFLDKEVMRSIGRFTYLSLGLSGISAETLLERPGPLAWALAALARPGKL